MTDEQPCCNWSWLTSSELPLPYLTFYRPPRVRAAIAKDPIWTILVRLLFMVRVTLGFRVRVRVSLGLGSSRVSVLAIVRCGALSYGGCELWSWLTLATGTSCITWSSNTRALSSLSEHSTRVCMTERSVLLTPPRRLWCHQRLSVCYHDYTKLFLHLNGHFSRLYWVSRFY